mmetsp:Transcript_8831/g.36096  ORF Transcript_8831/g.36096 Transcript_8831/m.36096 type:complete len:212 (-) Transcript_8831:368-1003(-)
MTSDRGATGHPGRDSVRLRPQTRRDCRHGRRPSGGVAHRARRSARRERTRADATRRGRRRAQQWRPARAPSLTPRHRHCAAGLQRRAECRPSAPGRGLRPAAASPRAMSSLAPRAPRPLATAAPHHSPAARRRERAHRLAASARCCRRTRRALRPARTPRARSGLLGRRPASPRRVPSSSLRPALPAPARPIRYPYPRMLRPPPRRARESP